MSQKLARIGPASPIVTSQVGAPTAVRLTGDGLRAFHRSQYTTLFAGASGFEGQINAVDWDGAAWSIVSGIGGQTGGSEIWDEGKNEFQIPKGGDRVAWDFQYKSPNSFQYTGIQISGNGSQLVYAFVPTNPAAPSFNDGTQVTPYANRISSGEYVPKKIRFSDDAARTFVYFQSFNNLIEVNPGASTDHSTLWFPFNGTYGNNLANFEISGDGNHLFVFIGGSLKLFSWDGASWQFSHEFVTDGTTCAVNYDGTILAIRASEVKVFQKSSGVWAQVGADLPDGSAWVNSTGTLVAAGSDLYEWTGTSWQYKWQTVGALSDDATAAVAAAGAGSIARYELKDVAPVYFGSTLASAIYAGATEGKAIYYGSTLLWNVAGWEPPAFTPASIAGLSLWLDASLGTYDAATGGNPVTTAAPVLRWEDQSGNANHATAVSSTAPSLALSQVNSLPGLLFPSAGGKFFELPNPLPSEGTGATIFVVTAPTQTGSDGGPLVGMIGSNTEYWADSHYPYRNSSIEDGFASTTRKTITPLPSNLFTWHLYNVISGGGEWRYLLNGAVIHSTSNTYNGASFSNRTPKIGFSNSRGSWYYRGTIAEILIYDTALSETDRQAVTEYLRAKYNLWTP